MLKVVHFADETWKSRKNICLELVAIQLLVNQRLPMTPLKKDFENVEESPEVIIVSMRDEDLADLNVPEVIDEFVEILQEQLIPLGVVPRFDHYSVLSLPNDEAVGSTEGELAGVVPWDMVYVIP